MERDPSINTRAIARNVGTNQTVRNVLQEQFLRPFHLQRVHNLEPVDYAPRVQFSQWYLEQCQMHPTFPSSVLFIDEATFARVGVFNMHNSHVWSDDNPHSTVIRAHQVRFVVNVWTGVVGDCLIGP